MSHPGSADSSFNPAFFRLLILLSLTLSGGAAPTVVYAQTKEQIIAVVNGRTISQSEVDESIAAQLHPLEQQIYSIRKAALENLILRTILEDEARKRGLTAEALRKHLTSGEVEVPAAEVEKVYAENATVFAAMSPDEAKERVRLDMESHARMEQYRKALSRLKESSKIELRLAEPRLPALNDDRTAPSKGPGDAPIVITGFSDFQCSYCRDVQNAINQILQSYKDRVRLVFKHLPMEEIHPQAFSAARAAYCASEHGSFWPYHDALFAAESLSPEVLKRLASDQGLNIQRFDECLNSQASSAAVRKDLTEAKRLGINSTPTLIINGRLFHGALSFNDLKAAIERELKEIESVSRTP